MSNSALRPQLEPAAGLTYNPAQLDVEHLVLAGGSRSPVARWSPNHFHSDLMPNKQVVFSDRIVGLSVQNGLVRIDLATIVGPAKTKDGKEGLKMDVTYQLVLPMDGFVAGFGMQQKLIKELNARQQKRSLKAPTAAEAAEQSTAAS